MIKKLAALVLVLAVAAPAMANIVPLSPHNYVWYETDSGEVDAFAEVERGDIVNLVVMSNWYNGSANGADTTVTWDLSAMDVTPVVSAGWHWSVYYPVYFSSGPGTYNANFGSVSDSYPINEGHRIIGWSVAIDTNAPFGLYSLGLVNTMLGSGGNATIPMGDAFAMTFNVTPEPATMSLLAIGGLTALLRRRRK